MIERIDGDVTRCAQFFSQFVIQVLGNVLLLVGVLVLLLREDWRIGLALTGFRGLCSLRPQSLPQYRRARRYRRAPGQRRSVRVPGRAAGRVADIRANGAGAM